MSLGYQVNRDDLRGPVLPEVTSPHLSLPTFQFLLGRGGEQGRAVGGHHRDDVIRGADPIPGPSKVGRSAQLARVPCSHGLC